MIDVEHVSPVLADIPPQMGPYRANVQPGLRVKRNESPRPRPRVESEAKAFFQLLESSMLANLEEEDHKSKFKSSFMDILKLPIQLAKDRDCKYSIVQQGDAWTNNIMFKFSEEKLEQSVMIDYQGSKISNPVGDILYMIFNCTDHETRSKYYYDWIDYYHTELERCLSHYNLKVNYIYPRDRLDADLRRYGRISFGLSAMLTYVLMRDTKEAGEMLESFKSGDPNDVLELMGTQTLQEETVLRTRKRIKGALRESVMIDYQASTSHNPVTDVLFLIFICSDHEARSKNFYDWIDYYHSELDKSLSNFGLKANYTYSRDQLDADIKRFGKIFKMLIKVNSLILDDDNQKEILKNMLTDVDKEIEELLKDKYSKYSVIQQGDAWTNNFMFKFEEGELRESVMIDYQASASTSPASDLLFMFFNCTEHETRSKNFITWIDYYYSELDNSLSYFDLKAEDIYPREQLDADIKRYAKISFAIIILFTNILMRDAGDAWTNNIMFKIGEDKVQTVMIDFQGSKNNNPVADLLYAIFNCTDHETRAKHFFDWIDYYHVELENSLSNFGLKANYIYSKDQLDADIKRYGKLMFGVSVMLANLLMRDTNEASEIMEAMKTTADMKELMESMGSQLSEDALTDESSVIQQGDAWTNNIMFKFEEQKLKESIMIDYQASKNNNPVMDLLFMIFNCTDHETRNTEEAAEMMESLNNGKMEDAIEAMANIELPKDTAARAKKRIATKDWDNLYSIIQQGDAWTNNIMFKFNGDELEESIMIDYQLSKVSNPVIDFLYMTLNCTDHETRTKNFYNWLNYYYSELDKSLSYFGLKTALVYPREQLDADIKVYIKLLFSLSLVLANLLMRDANEAVKVKEAMVDNGLEGVTTSMVNQAVQTDTLLRTRKRIQDLINSLNELGLLENGE
ncbi:unnamed protein product [Spodoptera exigua]|nr:unnamed protein product [Spodoptera exigua]